MEDSDLPRTEEELLETLRKLNQRDYMRRFNVDRKYARQLEAFGKKHPVFLIDELLRLTNAEYDSVEGKIRGFYEALHMLSENEELRIKLTHSSLDKTF